MTRADLDKNPADVAAMFDDVAQRYDLTNDILSLGQDRRWRRAVVEAVDVRPGERVLDLAAGTGTSSQPFADRGAQVVPCDFSLGMLRVGRRRRPDLPLVAGDATRLPFADASGTKVGLVYLYKSGRFYPFAPTGPERRDNLLEIQVRDALAGELPIEKDLGRWLAVWGAPGL